MELVTVDAERGTAYKNPKVKKTLASGCSQDQKSQSGPMLLSSG